ncbi:THUMP-like domain-containing protein [Robiginitalea sp.]|uniref:THUMP-like domain-containing protein n=2 Tax=Robiginitalea sp. TaxID=1902411 RepID=UPI003C71747F
MNKQLLTSDIQDFLFKNPDLDPLAVSLGKSPFPGVSPGELAGQLSGRKKARAKLPFWYEQTGIYYPPLLNLEQASSEHTGRYKGSLIEGDTLVDLTGGSGIDTYLMCNRFREVHYIERNPDLAQIAAHNFKVLGGKNIRVHKGDALSLLGGDLSQRKPFDHGSLDWIYLDPSRRKKNRSKVFLLQDCEPPLPDILPELFQVSENIMVKTSPMLDITEGIRLMQNVRAIHIVAVGNEVRELVWLLQKGYTQEAERFAVDLKTDFSSFRFFASQEADAEAPFHGPLEYLYEPNAAILKAGGFKSVATRFQLNKIHLNTHLYTSDSCIAFPGRRFKILQNLEYKPGKLPFAKANVSTRNFPESVATVRKRNRIKDGGETYLFFVRSQDESLRVLDCRRIDNT